MHKGNQHTWRLVALTVALLAVTVAVIVGCEKRAHSSSAKGAVSSLPPLENIKVIAADGQVTISWSMSRQFTGDYRGVRLYRVRDGRQIRYGKPVEDLLEDLGLRSSWTVSSLENGAQYEFILKAYDSDKKEFWSSLLIAYPGTDGRGAPRTPTGLYAAAGDGRVALFWERNREIDFSHYEIQRKGPDDKEFRTVAQLPKVLRLSQELKDTEARGAVPLLLSPAAFRDSSVIDGQSYQYRLRAVDRGGAVSSFSEPLSVQPQRYVPPTGRDVVLIVNANADDANGNGINDSEEVARYYAEKRGVPANQILRLNLKKNIYSINYARDIQQPLRQFLLSGNLAGRVTMLVPCFSVPTWSEGLALDSRLMDLFDRFISGKKIGTLNPYFDGDRHFDGTYGIYLVTRLDGPTVEIAKGLVDKALAAEQQVNAASGKLYLGGRGTKETGDLSIRKTAEFARRLGLDVMFKDPGTYAEHELGKDARWYFAWYHNYINPIQGSWPVGAVAAHLTSYSFSGIRESNPEKKCWVQGLLEEGITATFGSVVEPYQQGFTRAEIFFSHFWSGEYTFAESFSMATPTVQWAMSAVGDPLFRLKKLPVKRQTTPRPPP